MSWRDKISLFVLTKDEQRAIAFVALMLVLGLATRHYRATHPAKLTPDEQKAARLTNPSQSPGIRP